MNRVLYTSLSILLLAVNAFSKPLSLEQAIDIALEQNPTIQSIRSKLSISDAEVVSAGARPNPSIVSDNGLAEDTYRLGIEQTFELGGKRSKRIDVAKAQKNVTQSEIEKAVLDLRINVRKAYIDLYLKQEKYQVLSEILKTTEELLSVAKRREQAGDIAQLDVLQAEISVLNAEGEQHAMQVEKEQAQMIFNGLLAKPFDETFELSKPEKIALTSSKDPLEEVALEKLIELALSNRPELKRVELETVVAQEELSLAKINRIPDLSITAGPDIVVPDNGANSVNAFVIANMELPVWNLQQGPIKLAQAKKQLLQREAIAQRKIIELEVTRFYHAYLAHKEHLEHYENNLLPAVKTVLQKSRRSFEEGKSPIQIPLNAQQTYINTQLNYLNELEHLEESITEIEAAIGVSQ